VQLSVADQQKLLNLDRYDLLFYVSTNAARIGLDAIAQWWPQYPAHIENFAVGPGTAAVLEREGLQVGYPAERMTSEAMLALPGLQQISGKRALIVRGVGGREIIAAGLQARGVAVDYLELYERALPSHDSHWLRDLLETQWPDAVVISSGEALDNLKLLLAPLSPRWQHLPLAVSSPRLAEHATATGFAPPPILPGASDEAIIAGLLSRHAQQVSP
jgi:uroporphyrinogen-III synthase